MTFGEKVKKLRKSKKLSQTELGRRVGLSMRAVRGWEVEGRSPNNSKTYELLSEILDCPIEYLINEKCEELPSKEEVEEVNLESVRYRSFADRVNEQYGSKGLMQAQLIISSTEALFAGGELSPEDELAFVYEIQGLYLDAKERARKKYAPKNDTEGKE